MRRSSVLFLALVLAVTMWPRPASGSPEKAAGPLEINYYYLPG